jgi:hypothetical protein
MLPSFLVIGAQKSGTSSLDQYLRGHPQISMSRHKEPGFFTVEHNWARGLRWYERQFPGAKGIAAVGEASPSYSMHPLHTGVPARIASVIPDAKLIYLVRHPIERMRSHYQHRVAAGTETLPIEAAFQSNPHYLNTSRYAFQITEYLQHFSVDCLLVVLSDDLKNRREHTLRAVYEFLGVNPEWRSPSVEREWYVTSEHRQRRRVTAQLMRSGSMKTAAGKLPRFARDPLRKLTHRDPPTSDTRLSPVCEEGLRGALRGDVAALRTYVRGDFDGWGIA